MFVEMMAVATPLELMARSILLPMMTCLRAGCRYAASVMLERALCAARLDARRYALLRY